MHKTVVVYKNTLNNIVRIMVPLAFMHAFDAVSVLVDAIMVGHYNPLAIGGVTLGNTFFMFPFVICMSILLMSGPLIGQSFGAENRVMTVRVVQSAVFLGGIFAVFLFILYSNVNIFLSWLWFDDFTTNNVSDYVHGRRWAVVILFALPCRLFLMNYGFMKSALLLNIIGMPLNILFNWAFIYGNLGFQEMGVYGAGLATATSVVLISVGVLVVGTMRARQQTLSIWRGFPNIDMEYKKRILILGLGLSVSIVAEFGLFANLNMYAGYYEPVTISAFGLITNVWIFMFSLQIAMGEATNIYIARNAGKRKRGEVLRGLYTGLGVVSIFSMVTGSILLYNPQLIFHMIIDAHAPNSPEIIAQAVEVIPILVIGFLFKSYLQVVTRSLIAVNDTQFMPYVMLAIYCTLGPVLAYVLVIYLDLRLQGIFGTLTALIIMVSIIAIFRLKYRLQKQRIFAHVKT